MEEARGEMFIWNEIRENFTKEFRLVPEDDKLVEATNQIKTFIQLIFQSKSTQNYNRPKSSCNNIGSSKIP